MKDILLQVNSPLFDGVNPEDRKTMLGCIGFHLGKHFSIASSGGFEVDIHGCAFRNDIRVGIGFFFPFVVPLGVGDLGSGQVYVSCYGTVNPVVSWHGHLSFCPCGGGRYVGGSTSAEV